MLSVTAYWENGRKNRGKKNKNDMVYNIVPLLTVGS